MFVNIFSWREFITLSFYMIYYIEIVVTPLTKVLHELSAQRANTVARLLVNEGLMPIVFKFKPTARLKPIDIVLLKIKRKISFLAV